MSKPQFNAYNPKDKGKGETYWHKIGAAWPTKDGTGLTLQLDSLPLDGRITLLPPDDEQQPKASKPSKGGAQ